MSTGPVARVHVVCTAGHVDHGKSTLVEALTGTHPDRWAEEQRRGLTIDLGFAWADLPDGTAIAFVDLPGHERFVPNMLAGAGPVRVALFVVAADEGWMPQSAEHLDVLTLLGVRHGVVALTRADLVDDDTLALSRELVVEELAGSGLADAPVVPVAAPTGRGLDDLRAALAAVLAGAPSPEDRDRPRLWVDRAFTVSGAGTVVTGTLVDGSVHVGDALRVWPDGPDVRVRGVQVRGAAVEAAGPGSRVALNLAGVGVDDVGRGHAVARADQWWTTKAVDAWCEPVAGRVLGRRGAWTAHVGTAAIDVALHPTGGTDLQAPGPVRVELTRPLALAAGDRLVLRESGRGGTAGGGIVLHPAPGPRPRGRHARAAALETLTRAAGAHDGPTRLSALVAIDGAVAVGRALAQAGATPGEVAGADVVVAEGWLLSPERWTSLSDLALGAVLGAHQRHPALPAVDAGVPRRLLATTGVGDQAVEAVLRALVARGRLEQVPGGVRAPGHEPRLSVAQQVARTRLLEAIDAAGVEPPPLAELAADVEADDDLLAVLVADGQLVALPRTDRATTPAVLDAAVAAVAPLGGRFTAAEARDAWGTSRKHAVPLLEALGATGRTRRVGEHHVVV